MTTIPALGISNGLAPNKDAGALMVPNILRLSLFPQFTWDFGADGSAKDIRNMQSIYVDNSRNAKVLRITFLGALLTLPIPANSAGYFPCMSPINQFGFRAMFDDGAIGSDVPVVLFNVPMPYFVWKVQ